MSKTDRERAAETRERPPSVVLTKGQHAELVRLLDIRDDCRSAILSLSACVMRGGPDLVDELLSLDEWRGRLERTEVLIGRLTAYAAGRR